MSLVMITHDIGVARYLAQDGVVLREGEVRERGPMRQLLTDPEDSYTRMLLESAMDIRPPEPGDPGAQGTPARESATPAERLEEDRKSTRLNSSHVAISYAVFCLKKKNNTRTNERT